MKKIIFCAFLMLFFSFTLNANEKSSQTRNMINDYKLSFSECFDEGNYIENNLIEKMKKDKSKKKSKKSKSKKGNSVDYAQLSEIFLIVGIVGAVCAAVSLLVIITGAILAGIGWYYGDGAYYGYGNLYSSFWNPNRGWGWYKKNFPDDPNATLYLVGLNMVVITSILLVAVFIPAAVAGFILWYIFGKKAGTISMYMENRQGIVLSDAPYQNNSAIGLKFTF